MAHREITLFDAATGVEATVVVVCDDHTPQPRITVVKLAYRDGDGPGLNAEHLYLLEELGLPFPTGRPSPSASYTMTLAGKAPVPRLPESLRLPLPDPVAPTNPAKKTAKKQRYAYRTRPPAAVLLDAYEKHNGSPKAIAEMFEVPHYTAQSWIVAGRRKGLLPQRDGTYTPTPEKDDTPHATDEK